MEKILKKKQAMEELEKVGGNQLVKHDNMEVINLVPSYVYQCCVGLLVAQDAV